MNLAAALIRATNASPWDPPPAAALALAAAVRAAERRGSPSSYMALIRIRRSAFGAGRIDGDQEVTRAGPRIIKGIAGANATPRSARPALLDPGRPSSARLAQPSARP